MARREPLSGSIVLRRVECDLRDSTGAAPIRLPARWHQPDERRALYRGSLSSAPSWPWAAIRPPVRPEGTAAAGRALYGENGCASYVTVRPGEGRPTARRWQIRPAISKMPSRFANGRDEMSTPPRFAGHRPQRREDARLQSPLGKRNGALLLLFVLSLGDANQKGLDHDSMYAFSSTAAGCRRCVCPLLATGLSAQNGSSPNPWMRMPMGNAAQTAVFVVLKNKTGEKRQLVSAQSSILRQSWNRTPCRMKTA